MRRLLAKSEEERQKGPANGKCEECSAGSNNMIRPMWSTTRPVLLASSCSSALAVTGGPHSERGHSWREASTPAAVLLCCQQVPRERVCTVLHPCLENPVTQSRLPCRHRPVLCRLLAQPPAPGCMPHIKTRHCECWYGANVANIARSSDEPTAQPMADHRRC